MDTQLLRIKPIFEQECLYVVSSQLFPTKLRFILEGDYICDIFYRTSTETYSYALIKGSRRVLGWDNALHYPDLPNAPHHHHIADGTVVSSSLQGEPTLDIARCPRYQRLPPTTRGIIPSEASLIERVEM